PVRADSFRFGRNPGAVGLCTWTTYGQLKWVLTRLNGMKGEPVTIHVAVSAPGPLSSESQRGFTGRQISTRYFEWGTGPGNSENLMDATLARFPRLAVRFAYLAFPIFTCRQTEGASERAGESAGA